MGTTPALQVTESVMPPKFSPRHSSLSSPLVELTVILTSGAGSPRTKQVQKLSQIVLNLLLTTRRELFEAVFCLTKSPFVGVTMALHLYDPLSSLRSGLNVR